MSNEKLTEQQLNKISDTQVYTTRPVILQDMRVQYNYVRSSCAVHDINGSGAVISRVAHKGFLGRVVCLGHSLSFWVEKNKQRFFRNQKFKNFKISKQSLKLIQDNMLIISLATCNQYDVISSLQLLQYNPSRNAALYWRLHCGDRGSG